MAINHESFEPEYPIAEPAEIIDELKRARQQGDDALLDSATDKLTSWVMRERALAGTDPAKQLEVIRRHADILWQAHFVDDLLVMLDNKIAALRREGQEEGAYRLRRDRRDYEAMREIHHDVDLAEKGKLKVRIKTPRPA